MAPTIEFPWKVHKMLNQVQRDGREDIVSWMPSGEAFKVHNRKVFAKDILPVYFRHSNIRSFQRSLQIYGFRRQLNGPEKDAYQHPFFVQRNPDLINGIKRQPLSLPALQQSPPNLPINHRYGVLPQAYHQNQFARSPSQIMHPGKVHMNGLDDEFIRKKQGVLAWMLQSGCSVSQIESLNQVNCATDSKPTPIPPECREIFTVDAPPVLATSCRRPSNHSPPTMKEIENTANAGNRGSSPRDRIEAFRRSSNANETKRAEDMFLLPEDHDVGDLYSL